MSAHELKLPPNPAPAVVGALLMALAVWGFTHPEKIPWPASLFLILLGVLLVFQLKRMVISAHEISIRSLLTGKVRRILKQDINAILTADISTAASNTGVVKKGRVLTIRLVSKQNINISTSNISHADFKQLLEFLQKYYPEKLHGFS
ncbi:MAG: hypothetical protein HYZ14_09865 [Bacteroidetes bacterium]|nr:hypothetical protein [Bacteroidota bacterium]